jgi:hypothetical protein
MKNFAARTLASLLLGVLALGSMAHAQRHNRTVKATIPFEFGVGDRTFPSGNYLLVSRAPAFLELRDAEGRVLATVLTNSVETLKTPVSPKLTFNREDGRYVLAEVWHEDDSTGQQLSSPKASTKVAKRQNGHAQTVAASGSQ